MMEKIKKKAHGALLGALLAPLCVFMFQYVVYAVMPFDWFVNISKFEALDMEYGELDHQILMNRNTRFDIRGSATKEVYNVSGGQVSQTVHTNYKESFIYESSGNDKDFTLEVRYTDTPIPCGNYYTIDFIEIHPFFGITKKKIINTNTWEVICNTQ